MNSAGKQAGNDAGDDRRLQDLMADLETSIANFDERFSKFPDEAAAAVATSVRQAETAFPEIDVNARRDIRTTSAATAPAGPATPAGGTSLLAELADAAGKCSDHVQAETERRQRAAARIDSALRLAGAYLQQLTTHLNTLQPETPLSFALDSQTRLSQVKWQDSTTRSESDSRSERACLRKLTLRVRYTCTPLALRVASEALPRFEREMRLINLNVRDAGLVDIPGQGPGHRIEIEGSIPLQIALVADIDQARILMRCRNLLGLGLSAYVLAPETIDEAAMDVLGRCLLGRSTQLPPGFVPIAFNTPDSTA